jgi:hypothetical protein
MDRHDMTARRGTTTTMTGPPSQGTVLAIVVRDRDVELTCARRSTVLAYAVAALDELGYRLAPLTEPDPWQPWQAG